MNRLVSAERSLPFFIGAALALAAFHGIGIAFLDGFALDLGSLNWPTPGYLLFVELWTVFGSLAALLLAIGIAKRLATPGEAASYAAQWNAVPERRFIAWICAVAFLLPLALRLYVLRGAPLTDDESAYRFAAELLASGRLWVPSPPLKLFFDQNFMINDGRLYPVYFLGWPALLAPGIWLHAPGIVNPLLSALTVPALFQVLRRVAGPGWARGGAILFVSSPFMQIAAATLLSHTSCVMALTWCLWMCMRTRDEDASAPHHAAFGAAFALAFCIRPQSTAAIGLPLLAAWLLGLRQSAVPRLRAMLAFGAPAAAIALLFLASIWGQTGSPLRPGYARYAAYMAENHFRFTTFNPGDLTAVPGFDFVNLLPALVRTIAGLARLNWDLFGWPSLIPLIPLAAARGSRDVRLVWYMTASSLAFMFFQRDWGVDTFGPLHAFELALPVTVLTIVALRNLGLRMTSRQRQAGGEAAMFAPAVLAALIATAWAGFVPIRVEGVREIAAHLNVALQAPQRAGLHRAVVFAPVWFAPRCTGVPRHFVFFRPTNDPDLRNDVLWVNDLGPVEDRRLLETLPGRTGYFLRWARDCTVSLTPIGPPGRPGGGD